MERLKEWPFDETEPALSDREYTEAVAARDRAVLETQVLVQRYLDRYGQRIMHGEAEFSVAGVLRLAGWSMPQGS